MFDFLERLGALIRHARLLRPAAVAIAGWVGIAVARDNVESAPAIVGAAVTALVVATVLRERGAAVAALGVAATSAFATPAGIGPLLVLTGTVLAAHPSTVDRRLARWPEVVDGLIALPALAGVASVAAAQPSQRGTVVAIATGALVVGSWWRGPRYPDRPLHPDSAASYLGALTGVALLVAPEQFDVLGVLPPAVATAGRGVAAGLAVFALACLVQVLREERVIPSRARRAGHVARRPAR